MAPNAGLGKRAWRTPIPHFCPCRAARFDRGIVFLLACKGKNVNLSAMQWFYSNSDQPQGPVSEEEFQTLVKAGTIGPATLVWHEGRSEWALFKVISPASAVPPQITDQGQCLECHQWFPLDEVIKYENHYICAKCKPLFFQRVQEGVAYSGTGLWRKGKTLVIALEATLPDRCIKCNAPAHGFRLKRKLYWHPPVVLLLLCVNILIYAIVALLVRKRATIYIGLCQKHRLARVRNILITWISIAAFVASVGAAIAMENGTLGLLAFVLFWVAFGFGLASMQVTTQRIDTKYAFVNGARKAFLASLPEWQRLGD